MQPIYSNTYYLSIDTKCELSKSKILNIINPTVYFHKLLENQDLEAMFHRSALFVSSVQTVVSTD